MNKEQCSKHFYEETKLLNKLRLFCAAQEIPLSEAIQLFRLHEIRRERIERWNVTREKNRKRIQELEGQLKAQELGGTPDVS